MKTLSLVIVTLLFVGSCAYGQAVDTICRLNSLPSVHFDGINKKLDKKAKRQLDSIAMLLKANPMCGISVGLWVEGDWHGGKKTNYLMLSWYRTKAIVDYLNKNNIGESRLTFTHYTDDSLNDVKLRPLPTNDILFHPQLKIKQPGKRFPVDSSSIKTLKDSDGDGITDQFDLEPNTPPNAEVDTHGRAVDTDRDGVPDYLDKEKLTLAVCFPVNKDGVGVCPEPRYSIPDFVIVDVFCNLPKIPPIIFSNNSPKLTKDIIQLLNSTANLLRDHAGCSVEIIPYFPVLENNNHSELQLCWDEVYTIITYLEKAGIDESRLMFAASRPGNTNSVSIEATDQRGLYLLPPPYPTLSQIKGLPVKQITAEYEALKKSQQ